MIVFLRLILIAIAIAGLLFWGNRNARGDDFVAVTVGSYHFDRSKNYNEQNFGLGFEHRFNEQWRGHTGYYRNSFDRTTVYTFASYTPWNIAEWRVGAIGGVGTGYSSPVLASPFIVREWRTFGINLIVHPAAIAIQLKWGLR